MLEAWLGLPLVRRPALSLGALCLGILYYGEGNRLDQGRCHVNMILRDGLMDQRIDYLRERRRERRERREGGEGGEGGEGEGYSVWKAPRREGTSGRRKKEEEGRTAGNEWGGG